MTSWCILRTSGSKTLPLVRSLAAAGFDVWTPVSIQSRRLPRSKRRTERAVPIMPTFAFAPAHSLADLLAASHKPGHPGFSIFRHQGRIPLVADSEIEALRTEERKVVPKARQRVYSPGEQVKLPEAGFTGLTGIVEAGDGQSTLVCFGGRMRVKIDTWRLTGDAVSDALPDRRAAA